ncbi:MAG: T9SS type A sorting domain-containing protein [Flavobacteriales bacterium]
MKHFFTALLVLLFVPQLTAQTLDPTFGTAGVALVDAGYSDVIRDITLQADGKIIAAGWSYDPTSTFMMLARFHPDGTLDNTFGTNGVRFNPVVAAASGAEAVLVQPDGKILVAGYHNNNVTNFICVWRFNENGTVDNGFGSSGHYIAFAIPGTASFATGMALQPDGKILVTGPAYNGASSGACVLRLTTTGALDTSFNTTGYRVLENYAGNESYLTNCIALQTNGKILAAGTFRTAPGADVTNDALCIRLNSDGSFDTGFANGTGVKVVEVPAYEEYLYAIALLPDGRIMMTGDGQSTGSANWNLLFERLEADGNTDPSLGTSAILWNPLNYQEYARGLNIQPDGKYLITGSAVDVGGATAFAARTSSSAMGDIGFGSNGYLDADFGDWTYAEAALIQPDGKYLIAGNSASGGAPYDMMLARYDVGITMGLTDQDLVSNAIALFPNPNEGHFTLRVGTSAIDHLAIIDAQGRILRSMHALQGDVPLDLSELPPGPYSVKAIAAGKVTTLPFIKH